jgi:membrane associated rhomboid family serine protease
VNHSTPADMQSSGGFMAMWVRNLRPLRKAYVTWMWVIAIGVIHAVVDWNGGPQESRAWYEVFALSRDHLLVGKLWQLVTYGLLHGHLWHVGLNALGLLWLGSKIEDYTNGATLTKMIITGILAGGLLHVLLGVGILVGISGGVIALLLCHATLSPESQIFPFKLSAKNLAYGIWIAESGFVMIDPSLGLPGFKMLGISLVDHGMGSIFQMGHACHVGGAMAGWCWGRWLLRPRVTLERLQRDRAKREATRSTVGE